MNSCSHLGTSAVKRSFRTPVSVVTWAVSVLLLITLSSVPAQAGADWPMWGYDAYRSNASPEALELPEELHLQWARELPAPRRAWRRQMDDRDKLEFDLSYSPVVMGGRLFISSMTNDSLTAYSVESGEKLWRFYADGPARLAPAAHDGRVYFVSDDARLYCLDAATGELVWSYDTAPTDHRVLGNERVISMWAARGGPVVKDGTVYFAAGVWPFLGTFVFALDAETGEVEWANTGEGPRWEAQPHSNAFSFAGLAPQGYLAASGDRLVVSGGRALPGLFDRNDGSLIHLRVDGKNTGGYRVRIERDHYNNHGRTFRLGDGRGEDSPEPDDYVKARRAKQRALHERTEAVKEALGEDDEVFESIVADGRLIVTTTAGHIYCFGPRRTASPQVFSYRPQTPEPSDTEAGRLAAAILDRSGATDGYALVAGAGDGELLAQLAVRSNLHIVALEPDRERIEAVRRRLDRAGLYGPRVAVIPGRFAESHYPVYISSLVVAPDPEAAGLTADAATFEWVYERLRPYDGQAYLWLDPNDAGVRAALDEFEPENGAVETDERSLALVREGPLPDTGQWTHQYADSAQSVLSPDKRVRSPFGPIWYGGPTHDNIVPRHAGGPRPQVAGGRVVILGVETVSARCVYTGREIWEREFEGIGHPFTNLGLERRWRGGRGVYMTNQPGASYIGSPYVSLPDSIYVRYEGRIFRLDPATGETTAEWPLPQLPRGEDEDEPDWGHISVSGDTIITTTNPHIFERGRLGTTRDPWDGTSSDRLVAMDRHSGEVLWVRDAEVGFRHNAIISANGRLFVTDLLSEVAVGMAQARERARKVEEGRKSMIYALNIRTGESIWSTDENVFDSFLSYSIKHDLLIVGFRHNRIMSANGRLFVSDLLSEWAVEMAQVREMRLGRKSTIYALDIRTGEEIWSTDEKVFGTFLSYSTEHDILIEGASRDGRRPLQDEPSSAMIARRGEDGEILWRRTDESYSGPVILRDDMIMPGRPGQAINLLTGEDKARPHPITGQPVAWSYRRDYGCNTATANTHMLFFRTGSAGFADMEHGSGTGTIGGFRAGCTANLIPADGVLNAPDFTRTCTCSYQNQTSLGLIHMPEMEQWIAHGTLRRLDDPIQRIGINLGAPGNRLADNGTLWLHHPREAPSRPRPDLRVRDVEGADSARYYRKHSLLVEASSGLNYVAASGRIGIRRLDVRNVRGGGARFTVTLHFAEPEGLEPGERVFDIQLGDEVVVNGFDVAEAAGGANRAVARTFENVEIDRHLQVRLNPAEGSEHPPVLSGVELIRQDD